MVDQRTFLVEVVFHDVRELPDGLERLADLQFKFKRSIEYCLLHGLNIKEARKIHVNKVQTVSRAPICPRGNMSYFQPYPVNNTISNLNNAISIHHKPTLNPDLPYNWLPYKRFVLCFENQ